MGDCGAVKCAKTHKCANAHICANISPTNVQTSTFVQTFRPQNNVQICKKKKKKKKKKNINHKYANITPTKCANVQF